MTAKTASSATRKSGDTICAVATPSGRGGISIIRISGPDSAAIAKKITALDPRPRHAHYGSFKAANGDLIDQGITLFFPGPDSFTGEDVVEFHAHGGPVVVDLLLQEILNLGLRLAKPGEFSERAFLNDKIDLAQAEAIADLIESHSIKAARFALRSMQGDFSNLVNTLVSSIVELRKYVEAAMDFPEEEVDFLASGEVDDRLDNIVSKLEKVIEQARQGSILKEGLTVVIAGEPNAGKSSLLNKLAGQSRAIVTEIAGTTRDTLKEHISIDGMPLHIIDTAGLRASEDLVEIEGMKRTWQEIRRADLVILVVDATASNDLESSDLWTSLHQEIGTDKTLFIVYNKTDLSGDTPRLDLASAHNATAIYMSALTGNGIEFLKDALKNFAGYNTTEEGGFIARRRHLDALKNSLSFLASAKEQLATHKAGELVADDLKHAHVALELITGTYTPDDLLGEIFSSFCIGK